jgi:hypothetical protein
MFKSIKTGVLAAILISTTIVAHAQKKLTEGTLVYGITYKIDAPGAPAENKIKFNGDVSKMEIEAGPASVGVFVDQKTGAGLVTVSVPIAQMQKAAKMSKAEVEESNPNKSKLSDFKATGEKAVIAGYNAEKYTYKNAKGESGELWATTELELPINIITSDFKEVKGTVVKYSDASVTVTLKSIKEDKVGTLSISTIPSGFDEITYAELKAMQGGGE